MARANARDYLQLIRGLGRFTRILRIPGINGFAVGRKWTGGEPTRRPAVIVYVAQKLPLSSLSLPSRIPSAYRVPTDRTKDGYLEFVTDVQQATFSAAAPIDRVRPAPAGTSMAHVDVTAGTFGGLVRDRRTGERVILSNNHVLADSNNAALGDPVLQPGPADGGSFPQDHIADLLRYVPIDFASSAENRVDGAIAEPLDASCVEWSTEQIGDETPGMSRRVSVDDLGLAARKSGRTTGLTEGFLEAVAATVQIQYSLLQQAVFVDQLVFSQPSSDAPFSAGGDSGSLIYDQNDAVLGLLFAGSTGSVGQPATTIANPWAFVADELEVDLLGPPPEVEC